MTHTVKIRLDYMAEEVLQVSLELLISITLS